MSQLSYSMWTSTWVILRIIKCWKFSHTDHLSHNSLRLDISAHWIRRYQIKVFKFGLFLAIKAYSLISNFRFSILLRSSYYGLFLLNFEDILGNIPFFKCAFVFKREKKDTEHLFVLCWVLQIFSLKSLNMKIIQLLKFLFNLFWIHFYLLNLKFNL